MGFNPLAFTLCRGLDGRWFRSLTFDDKTRTPLIWVLVPLPTSSVKVYRHILSTGGFTCQVVVSGLFPCNSGSRDIVEILMK